MFKRTFPKGKVLFKEGDPGLEAFLVEKGKVLILKKGTEAPIIVASLGPGALFGEMAILDGAQRLCEQLDLARSYRTAAGGAGVTPPAGRPGR